jgi:trimethylamine---corrinoid protein Co-methyltransferase
MYNPSELNPESENLKTSISSTDVKKEQALINLERSHAQPNYRLLTQDQIKELHLASLSILEQTGIRVLNEDARCLMVNAGCEMKSKEVVLIPRGLVENAIRSAPRGITIYDRSGSEAMRLEGRNNYFGTGTDLIRTVDLETRQDRLSILQDVINAAIISDYCSDVDFIASYALPSDVPNNSMYLRCVKAMMENSTKPIFFTAAGKEDLESIHDMAAAISGSKEEFRSKPFLIHYSEPTAPLTHSYGAINKLLYCAENSIPICYTAGDILGGTTPVTLAGGIAQANAENLSGIVIHQLKAKGAPIISGFGLVPLDMRTTTFSYGAPDFRLTNSAFADLYHHYQLPMWSTVGSDSFCLDEQASMEHAFGTLMAALDGANLIHDIGYLGQGLLGDPAAIVMCDEIISYVKRIIRGFTIDQNTLALDLIDKVGPGGNYLAEIHTARNFRKELWQPKFVNRETHDGWENNGRKAYRDRVVEKAKEILKIHSPEPLSEEIKEQLDTIAFQAEANLKNMLFNA